LSTTAAAAPAEAQLERRREAIEASGWGERFKLVQPHNLCFWVYVVLVAIGLLQFVREAQHFTGFLAPSLISASILFALYGLGIFWALRLMDRYAHKPLALVLAAFAWGATAAVYGIAVHGNDANIALMAKLFGQAFAADWGAALSAPFVEETAKGAGFVLILALAPRLIRSLYDAIFVGAFIGLGFQILEDIQYGLNGAVAQFGSDQFGGVISTFLLRGATGITSHALYTAVFSAGLLYAIGTSSHRRRVGIGLALMAAAVLAHGVWDGAAAIGEGGVGANVAMLAAALIGWTALIVAVRRGMGPEREWMRAILAPEVSSGTLKAEELDALVARRKERKRFIHGAGGHKERKRAKHLLVAAGDLARELAASGGADSPGVEHARAEIARLRSA